MPVPVYAPNWQCPSPWAAGVGYTWVYIIPAADILFNASKVTLHFGYPGTPWRMGAGWIGHPNGTDPYDFDGNQVQITVASATDVIINDADTYSDELTFALDSSKNLLLAIYTYTYNNLPRGGCDSSAHSLYYKAGNDAATTDKSGYAGPTAPDYTLMFSEILAPPAYKLSGTVKEKGSPVVRTVRAYTRSTGALYSSGASGADGTFTLDAPDNTTEMFVIAFDDDEGEQYNALIFDRVKGVAV